MSTETLSPGEVASREKFDAWSDSGTFSRLQKWLRQTQAEVLDRIDWTGVESFLDVGCGDGWAVVQAAERLRTREGGLACGCDISSGMLASGVRTDLLSTARFQISSAQNLPYVTETFDVVICTAAFHHFPRPEGALREFRRVLKPGGRLLVAETCRNLSFGTWIWDRLNSWFEEGHQRYLKTREMQELFTGAGFQGVNWVKFRPTFRETGKLVRAVAIVDGTRPR